MGEREHRSPIHRIRVFWKWLARRDELPRLKAESEPSRQNSSILSWLIAPEDLPRQSPTHARPQQKSWRLLSTESLPNPPCQDVPAADSALRWLFQPEKLPAPPIESASKEAL